MDSLTKRLNRRPSYWQSAVQLLAQPQALLGLVMLLAVLYLSVLTVYPKIYIDEPWGMSRAWSAIRTGDYFDVLHREATSIAEPTRPGTFSMMMIGSIKIFGLNLFGIRLTAWIAGLLLLLLTYQLGRQLADAWTGALAVTFLFLSDAFILYSHIMRKDVFVATLAVGGFLCFVIAQKRGLRWLHLLAGLCLGVAMTFHDNAVAYILALGVLYLHDYGWKFFRSPMVWLGVLGGSVALWYRLAMILLSDPEGYVARARYVYGAEHQIPLLSNSLKSIVAREYLRYRYYFIDDSRLLELGLVALGVGFALWRFQRRDRWLLIIVSVPVVVFALLVGSKDPHYLIGYFPYYCIMAAIPLVQGLREAREQPTVRQLLIGVVLVFTLVPLGAQLIRIQKSTEQPTYSALTEELRQIIPEGSKVMGGPTYWLALNDRDYRGTQIFTMLNFERDYTLNQTLNELRPEYIIVDDLLRSLLVDKGYFPKQGGFQVLRLPREEFENFLDRQGTRVLRSPFNNVEVYKIDWP